MTKSEIFNFCPLGYNATHHGTVGEGESCATMRVAHAQLEAAAHGSHACDC